MDRLANDPKSIKLPATHLNSMLVNTHSLDVPNAPRYIRNKRTNGSQRFQLNLEELSSNMEKQDQQCQDKLELKTSQLHVNMEQEDLKNL